MPGSRRAEVDYIAPVFFDAAARLARSHPGLRFVLPVADVSLRPVLESMLGSLRCRPGAVDPEAVVLVDGHSHDCLEACDGALIASGTATLEGALYKKPMVIAYRMPAVSAWIMRRIGGYLPWVGLPNILANEWLVPELLQEAATGEAIATALEKVLDDNAAQSILREKFQAMHESLRRDTPALASQAILQTIAEVRPGTRHAQAGAPA
jgi:lipid-A-disaccharide synthase